MDVETVASSAYDSCLINLWKSGSACKLAKYLFVAEKVLLRSLKPAKAFEECTSIRVQA
jgi:hypothetical protein